MTNQPDHSADPRPGAPKPLPIWFFVGLILLINGILVTVGSSLGSPRATVLAELEPGLWWGAVIAVAGLVFTAIGWKTR